MTPSAQPSLAAVARSLHLALSRFRRQHARLLRTPTEVAGHQFRVACRRLLAALDVAETVADAPEPGRLSRAVKERFELTSDLRETQVSLLLLGQVRAGGAAAVALRRRLADRVREQTAALTAAMRAAGLGPIPSGVQALLERLRSPEDQPVSVRPLAALDRRVSRSVRRVQRRLAAVERQSGADRLHRLRLALKRARYTLEILGAVEDRPVEAAIRAARRLQDALGGFRDAEILVGEVKALLAERPELVRRSGPLRAGLAELCAARQRTLDRRLALLVAHGLPTEGLPPAARSGLSLVLIRHAEAEPRDPSVPDPTRRLTRKGERTARRIGKTLRRLGLDDARVLTSPAERALATARIVSTRLRQPEGALTVEDRLAPGGSVSGALEALSNQGGVIVLVGHEPELSRLASRLLVGRHRLPLRLRKGGALLITGEAPGDRSGLRLEWLMKPGDLGRLRS
jgi:phosphohistidine phosphatase